MKKSKKKSYKVLAIISLSLLLLCVAGVLFYTFFSGPLLIKDTWYMKSDMTDTVEENISNYMNEAALGDEIDIKGKTSGIYVAYKLELNSDGTYSQYLDEESYSNGLNQAEVLLKQCVAELMNLRLSEAGLDTSMDADSLIKEATGMESDDYYKEYGPTLLPTGEELGESYCSKGTYIIENDIITLHNEESGTDISYKYMVSDKMLVLDNNVDPLVYYRGNMNE